MEHDSMGSEWGGVKPPVPKRKLIDMHDVGGLILFGIVAAPFVWMFVKWLLGM